MTEQALAAFVTLFVVIDPIGLAPIFAALTAGMTARRRRIIAVRAVAIAFTLLMIFALIGEALLEAVGIGMPAFRISGGILLFLIAVEMLFEKRTERREKQADVDEHENDSDPSVFPLALPLVAGPGALASIILLMGEQQGNYPGQLMIAAMAVAVLLIVLILFLGAGLIERITGPTGINLITRILGVLLAALSVQFVLDGLKNFGVITG